MSSASVNARLELDRLLDERRTALNAGLGANAAYVGLAVTEIASFRAALSGPQVG